MLTSPVPVTMLRSPTTVCRTWGDVIGAGRASRARIPTALHVDGDVAAAGHDVAITDDPLVYDVGAAVTGARGFHDRSRELEQLGVAGGPGAHELFRERCPASGRIRLGFERLDRLDDLGGLAELAH